jgi:hypothetical protein
MLTESYNVHISLFLYDAYRILQCPHQSVFIRCLQDIFLLFYRNDNIHEDLVVSESEDEIKEEINTVS